MVKARTWFTLFIMALATVAATASCGSDEGTGGGTGGGSVLDGGNGGKAGAVGRAGSGGGSPTTADTTLGTKCTSDAQCTDGMVCLTAGSTALNGGGPAGGMCTLACTGTTDCTAIAANSDCFNFGTTADPKLYCLDGCTQGGDATTGATKCQGRGDFACVDLSSTTVPDPFCIPLCRSDVECGTGLFCNKGSGLCSKTKAPAGDPVGTACTPGAATDNCEGFCIRTTADGVTPVAGVCAEFCAGLLDCMYNGTTPGGLCGGPLSTTFGLLDLGYCLPSCGCTGDCPFPGDLCRAWTSTEQALATDLGKPGLCYPNVDSSVELPCSGAAGAGGDPGMDQPGTAGDGGAAGAH